MRIYDIARWWDVRYDGRRKLFKGIMRSEYNAARMKARLRRLRAFADEHYAGLTPRKAYEAVVELSDPANREYMKVAMYGHSWLYMCSPVYGHRDYNKSRLLPIAGNKHVCAFLHKVSERRAHAQS